MTGRFADTTVLAHAYGGAHPQQVPCQQILRRVATHAEDIHLSTEAIQEFIHHRMRRVDREVALRDARDVVDTCVLHPFDAAVLARSLDLIATTSIRGRDAVHAATALENGFTEIISADPDFDSVPGLRRIDPLDLGRG